jgi:alkyl hydroperoxide reductase subunit AhpF
MPFIRDQDRATIARLFEENLVDPVSLVYFTTPKSLLYVPGMEACETCEDVQRLLEEIVGISDKLTLEVHDLKSEREEAQRFGVARVPALILQRDTPVGQVRYFGAPTGHEFPNLIRDIAAVSRRETGLSEATRTAIGAIPEPIHLQVFVTPT